jgi:sterol 14-demethylase
MDLLRSLLDATPVVRDQSGPVQAVILAIGIPLVAVVLNVASQLLLPKRASAPPVVFHYVPIVGSAVTYGMDPYKFFFDNREKYGDVFTFKLLGRNITVALGPKGSNLVFNGRLKDVSAEEAYTHLTTPVFGKEVVYDVPNAVLMEQKKLIKTGLSTDNFRVYVGQITDEVSTFVGTDSAFKAFQQGRSKVTGTVDIFKAMCEITILTASRTLQGREVRDALDKTFADLYHDLDMGFNPINFVIPNLPLPSNFRRDRAQKQMSNFYKAIIQKRREGKSGHDDTEHDMIASLMQQTYKNGRPLRDVEIAHIMIALLMAGQHTSSATLSWGMLRLASRPEIIEELYAEQQKVFGDADGTFRPLDYETQKEQLPMMDCVVRETLRLHPPIHSIMRKVLSDIPVPPTLAAPESSKNSDKAANETYVIPAGHFVMAAPGVSQMDAKVWRDAERFDPHRWMDKNNVANMSEDKEEEQDYGWGAIKSGGNSPYLPFGAGRHRCIGEQFAYLQLGTILSYFVRRFSWKLETTFPGPDYTSMIVLPQQPANIVLTERT